MGWVIENKEWIFSGIGVVLLTSLLGLWKSKSEYKATPLFYEILFVGVVLAFGIDYLFNPDGDWRLGVFIFGTTIVITFICEQMLHRIMRIFSIRKRVNDLSLEDCKYVVKCYEGNEYFVFNFTNQFEFQEKWDKVLYIPRGQRVVLHEPYKIYTDKYAYKLAKKKLERGPK